jgi:hypothetical protein
MNNNIVLRGNRIVVIQGLRPKVLQIAQMHQVIVRIMKTKKTVFLPRINLHHNYSTRQSETNCRTYKTKKMTNKQNKINSK